MPGVRERTQCGRLRPREDVVYTAGEFIGEPGVAVIAMCGGGLTSVIPYSVSPRASA